MIGKLKRKVMLPEMIDEQMDHLRRDSLNRNRFVSSFGVEACLIDINSIQTGINGRHSILGWATAKTRRDGISQKETFFFLSFTSLSSLLFLFSMIRLASEVMNQKIVGRCRSSFTSNAIAERQHLFLCAFPSR